MVTCITLGLENGNSNFRKQSSLLYPGEDRSTKAPSCQSSRAPCYVGTYPPLGSTEKPMQAAERLRKHPQVRTMDLPPEAVPI